MILLRTDARSALIAPPHSLRRRAAQRSNRDRSNTMSRIQIAWLCWAIGTILVVLSWFGVVSYTIGWCGFALGLVGSVISCGLRPPSN